MATKPRLRLILASGSRGRRYLMERAGHTFEVLPANVDEPTGEDAKNIREYVHTTAWMKAAAVAPQVDDALIIAADTVGWLDGKVIGKPADEADARRILRTLGGREHELWTGVVLWRRPGDLQTCWQEVSRVFVKALTDRELDEYIATRQWEGCSGAYAIKEDGDPFVSVVSGSLSNVIGLPMESLTLQLEREG